MVSTGFPDDARFARQKAVTGIDEVGRGCLAGPVVVAALTWSPKVVAGLSWFPLLADSKALSAARREELYPQILAAAERVRLAVLSPVVIDALNILQATLHGFELTAPAYDAEVPLVIDGNKRPASLPWAATFVKGDSRVSAVAGAAVVAKVYRDRLMTAAAKQYPGYGFEDHKGYATPQHRKGIETLGPCNQHRRSFRPVKDLLPQEQSRDAQDLAYGTDGRISLEERWVWFTEHYHHFSHHAVRTLVDTLHKQGLRLLPTPGEVRTL